MPELPEVETMRLSLLPHINKLIFNVIINNPNLRKKINPYFINDIKGSYILSIDRIGKYLLFNLSNNKCLVFHAGMSGKFFIEESPPASMSTNKHNHVILHLEPQTLIYFNDPRRFGLALTFNNKTAALKYINLGIDALNDNLTVELLSNLLNKSKCEIKSFLLNQKLIAGIGNIYASEILFYSQIHPFSIAKNIPSFKISSLIKNIKKVLNIAVTLGGSTLKDYKQPSGEIGYFQNNFAVYQQEKVLCKRCRTPIEKIKQKGRSTYFCPAEQILY